MILGLTEYIFTKFNNIGSIYLYNINKNIYKIGKTLNHSQRSQSYTGSTLVYLNTRVMEYSNCEKQLIKLLSDKFKPYHKGKEYFLCDDEKDIKDIVSVFCDRHNQEHEICYEDIPLKSKTRLYTEYIEKVFLPAFYNQTDEDVGNVFMSKQDRNEMKRLLQQEKKEELKKKKDYEKHLKQEWKNKWCKYKEHKIQEFLDKNIKVKDDGIVDFFALQQCIMECYESNLESISLTGNEIYNYITKIWGKPDDNNCWKGYEIEGVETCYHQFTDELIIQNSDAPMLSLTILYSCFRDWFVDNYNTRKGMPTKYQVKNYFTYRWGEPIDKYFWKGYEIRSSDNMEHDNMELQTIPL